MDYLDIRDYNMISPPKTVRQNYVGFILSAIIAELQHDGKQIDIYDGYPYEGKDAKGKSSYFITMEGNRKQNVLLCIIDVTDQPIHKKMLEHETFITHLVRKSYKIC